MPPIKDVGVDITVQDHPARHLYEARTPDGRVAGRAFYRLVGGLVTFTHTEVEPEFEGEGVGSRLAHAALADARQRGLGVRALCPFFLAYLERHPEEADLVVE